MKLTDLACKAAKADIKTRRLFDGNGLYLEVTTTGRKYWRLKYRYGGKEKRYAIGVYPGVTLSEARESTEEAKRNLRQGIDPTYAKRTKKLELADSVANSFQNIAIEWFEAKEDEWTSKHAKNTKSRLEMHIYPYIGTRPINSITARELLETLRRVESKTKSDLTRRLRSICSQVFRYAIITERCDNMTSKM